MGKESGKKLNALHYYSLVLFTFTCWLCAPESLALEAELKIIMGCNFPASRAARDRCLPLERNFCVEGRFDAAVWRLRHSRGLSAGTSSYVV